MKQNIDVLSKIIGGLVILAVLFPSMAVYIVILILVTLAFLCLPVERK